MHAFMGKPSHDYVNNCHCKQHLHLKSQCSLQQKFSIQYQLIRARVICVAKYKCEEVQLNYTSLGPFVVQIVGLKWGRLHSVQNMSINITFLLSKQTNKIIISALPTAWLLYSPRYKDNKQQQLVLVVICNGKRTADEIILVCLLFSSKCCLTKQIKGKLTHSVGQYYTGTSKSEQHGYAGKPWWETFLFIYILIHWCTHCLS